MARIAINTGSQLDALLSSVAEDTVTASIHWELCKDLWSSTTEFVVELNQSRAFWSLTMNAHREVTLFRLGRLYDQHKGALSLPTLLKVIKANIHRFSEPDFRSRLKGNPFVDSLASTARRPDASVLERDIEEVSEQSDDIVKKLADLRNQVLAHVDPGVVLGTLPNPTGNLSQQEIDKLFNRAATIVNRYSSLFKATSNSMRIVGHDDYRQVLLSVRRDLVVHQERLDEELAALEARLNRSEVF